MKQFSDGDKLTWSLILYEHLLCSHLAEHSTSESSHVDVCEGHQQFHL